ncbi:hypothetical protein [Niallia sp. 03133]|uniref:hypothetical protein n=1 Tax=Niallia sp. 03133 TaxID=3458060 RepID=UPI004044CD25
MLKKQFEHYIQNQNNKNKDGKYTFLPEEKAYVLKHGLLEEAALSVTESAERFQPIYMELADKESDDIVKENMESTFLEEKMHYFEKNLDYYLYMETEAFQLIKIDAVTLEVDSVFRTYEAMFGLKLPKKLETSIRAYFDQIITNKEQTYNLIFNNQDGLWEVNFPIETLSDFSKNMEIREAMQLIYSFLFQMEKNLEGNNH